MWIKKFLNNWISTTKEIYKASTEVINREKLGLIHFFWKALKESSIGAYYVFLKAEIDWIIKKNEIENTINKTSNEVAYLLWWYYLSPATLLELKNELESKWINVKIINKRYYSKESIWVIIRELKNSLTENKWKDIVLFWYSAWWAIAHRVWAKNWYKSISFWLSEDPKKTMVWTLLSLTKEKELENTVIPESGTNIIESFSWMVPNTWEIWENTIRLNDVYSHMTIWKKEVIDEVVKQILLWFKN